MSKIGNAVLEAQERTGKEVGELEDSDLAVDGSLYLAEMQYQIVNSSEALYETDLSELSRAAKDEVLADIDASIAKLTQVAEKLQ